MKGIRITIDHEGDRVAAVRLASGETLAADLVVMAVGIRPNVALAKSAGIEPLEMLRTFNCGIGLIAVTDVKTSGHVIDAFQESGNKAMRISHLVRGEGEARCLYRGALKL